MMIPLERKGCSIRVYLSRSLLSGWVHIYKNISSDSQGNGNEDFGNVDNTTDYHEDTGTGNENATIDA